MGFQVRPYGFETDGTWVVIGVNDCMRVSIYADGERFAPHRDGGFVYNNEVLSRSLAARHATPRHATPRHATPCHATPRTSV